jgi:hypothetical protein
MTDFSEMTRLYSDCIATVSSEENGYGSYDRFTRDDTAIIISRRDTITVSFISLAPLREGARDKIILFRRIICTIAMILILPESK